MFPHNYSTNYNGRTTTPHGIITLICYFGSCTLAGHSLQQESCAPNMSYCCAQTTLQNSETCTDHGQNCLNSWSNLFGQKKHSRLRPKASGNSTATVLSCSGRRVARMEVVSPLIASDSLLQKLVRFFCVHHANLAYDPSPAQHSGEFSAAPFLQECLWSPSCWTSTEVASSSLVYRLGSPPLNTVEGLLILV